MKKMKSTKRIPEGTILRVYKKGYGYSRLKVIDNNDNYIGAVSDESFFNFIEDGGILETYLWVENVASYEFNLKVIGRITSGMLILFFDHTGEISRSEKRKCLKTEVNIPIHFFLFNSMKIEKDPDSREILYHNGEIVNLSDREASIICHETMPQLRFLYGHITVAGIDIELVGRIDPPENNSFHLIMSGMTDRDRMVIQDYIFSIYRE